MNWVRTLLAILAAGGLALAVWWAMNLRLHNTRLTAENASLMRSVAALKEQAALSKLAREVEIARAERWRARAGELSTQIETILLGDFPDAALDPDLADLLNRLREGD